MILTAEQRLQLAIGAQACQLAMLATENEHLKAENEQLKAQLGSKTASKQALKAV